MEQPDFITLEPLSPKEVAAVKVGLSNARVVEVLLGEAFDKGFLAGFVAPERRIYDWRDHPVVKPRYSKHPRYKAEDLPIYVDTCELDEICKTALISPSFRAMVNGSAYVQNQEIYYDADEALEGDAFFNFGEVGLRYHQWERNDMYPASLGHEMRHAWQEERALSLTRYFPVLLNMALRRLNEADSTALMITVAAEINELSGNDSVLESMRASDAYGVMTEAFMDAMEQAPEALWNGNAQRAALLAYLQFRPILNAYDLISIREETRFIELDLIPPVRLAKRAFTEMVNRHFSMPYEAENGELIVRPHYSGLKNVITPNLLLGNINPAIRNEARRLDRVARHHYTLLDAAAPSAF